MDLRVSGGIRSDFCAQNDFVIFHKRGRRPKNGQTDRYQTLKSSPQRPQRTLKKNLKNLCVLSELRGEISFGTVLNFVKFHTGNELSRVQPGFFLQ